MQSAILDSCVLYPAPLRDFFMRLAVQLYQPKWTETIHEEWIRSVLADRPDLTRAQLARTRELMDRHGGACLVTGYESLIPTLTLPDPDDRHVLAAGIRAGANVIVTANLSDFPAEILSKYGIEAQHPDEFINHLLDLAPHVVCGAAKRQRESLKNPPKTVDEYLESLERQGLAQTVARLKQFAELI